MLHTNCSDRISVVYINLQLHSIFFFFFFNDTATTEIYTLSLHDALPICSLPSCCPKAFLMITAWHPMAVRSDRKSTRLNSSHGYISYAVFCLKKKKKTKMT